MTICSFFISFMFFFLYWLLAKLFFIFYFFYLCIRNDFTEGGFLGSSFFLSLLLFSVISKIQCCYSLGTTFLSVTLYTKFVWTFSSYIWDVFISGYILCGGCYNKYIKATCWRRTIVCFYYIFLYGAKTCLLLSRYI